MSTVAAEPNTRPYVQVENLVARYGTRTILDGVSCSARRGEITVIQFGRKRRVPAAKWKRILAEGRDPSDGK